MNCPYKIKSGSFITEKKASGFMIKHLTSNYKFSSEEAYV